MREIKFRVWDKVRQKMFKPQAISFDTQTLAPFAVSVPGRSCCRRSRPKATGWKKKEPVYLRRYRMSYAPR